MHLTEFRVGVLGLLEGLLTELGTFKGEVRVLKVLEQLKVELERGREVLQRYRLREILRRKVRQRMRSSVSGEGEGGVLEKSMLMLERDLGMESEVDGLSESLRLSSVVTRSLLLTPVKQGSGD